MNYFFKGKFSNIYILIGVFFSLTLSACQWPKDPDDTFKKIIRNGQLRVAVIQSPPWVNYQGSIVSGIEVEIISQFAASIKVYPVWKPLSEQMAVIALKKHQVDLIIGGLTDQDPWQKYFTMTRPYFTAEYYIGLPKDHAAIRLPKNQNIAVKTNSFLIPYIMEKDFKVLESADPFTTQLPVAAEKNYLIYKAFKAYIKLCRFSHVIVVPLGENYLLKKLESFLKHNSAQFLQKGINPDDENTTI